MTPKSMSRFVSGSSEKVSFGAGNRTRTGDINLGKVALYQLSYSRLNAGTYRTMLAQRF